MIPALCIGTAQLGMAYGATNQKGRFRDRSTRIVEIGRQFRYSSFDTAQAYGDAEQVLGRNLVNGHNFKIISKLVPWIKLLLYLTILRIGKKSFQRVVTGYVSKLRYFAPPLTIRFKETWFRVP